MPEEEKQEEKYDFTADGEAVCYISLAQARFVSIQTARETPGDYGDRLSGVTMVFAIIESKGYRREDAGEKKATMETDWVPGVNNVGQIGRWAFAEFADAYQIQSEFDELINQFVGVEAEEISSNV